MPKSRSADVVDSGLARQFVETVPGPKHTVDALETVPLTACNHGRVELWLQA